MSTHHAPSVSYPVGRSSWVRALLGGVWLLAGGVTLQWWQVAAAGDPGPWLGLAAWLASGLGLWIGWQRTPMGLLVWNAGLWAWESRAYPGQVIVGAPEVLLDLQHLLLVRMTNSDGASWMLWLDATREPARWLDLRRALYAPARRAAGGDPPSGLDRAT
jgi:hypothetical protein